MSRCCWMKPSTTPSTCTSGSATALAPAPRLAEGPGLAEGPAEATPLGPALLRVVPETAEEAAEQPALPHQGRCRRWRLSALPPDGLGIVGPRDGVHDLRLIESLRAGDLRNEPDQVPVEQHLGLQGRRAFVAPDRLAPVGQHDTHPVDINPGILQVRVDATIPESVGDPPGPVLVHPPNLPSRTGCPISLTIVREWTGA